MNVKEYINSGIVESYVLGLATDAERTEFEQVCAAHPEVAEARDAFERSLENVLLQDAAASASVPPSFLKTKIVEAITPPAVESQMQEETVQAPVRRLSVWKLLAAASFLGLLAVGYWAYNTNEKYKDALAQQENAKKELQQSTAQLESLQQQTAVMQNPGMKMVALKGTAEAPQAQTAVFWDTTGTSKDVYLMVNNLPQPATDKQYQLWAMLNGKPIDLGVFDYDVRQKRLLIRMKNVQNAQAFAISLEKRGGSSKDVPEGGVYVLGNL